ncbi:uncharacterized protein BJ171DRAFT_119904 [Polychytrium aggregatum]|uniref:uncharacterized protein n=1 Tax=Polychytrium aggregatum TaxID=110093 RepID=UPI0022FDF4F7|nr:uncharacterized protein BJ171DRAFT_119904 [Polychytrium aggregatum]KAI9204174.1 hypothetical protein BJ171DRAFT_119904 [Polychytrium aggregatum]
MTKESYLVIGGGGFLGGHIVDQLVERGDQVAVFDMRVPREPNPKVEYFTGDLCSPADLAPALKSRTVVIHSASPPHGLPDKVFFKVNVEGTQTILDAAVASGVRKFVYTSSASVIYNGQPMVAADETWPFPETMDAYNQSKAQGESLVLSYNGKNGMATCALRPSGIFGPRDAQGGPAMLKVANEKSHIYMIGNNRTLFDMTFVVNAAYAHLQAADKLESEGVAGEAFIITNDQPMFFWDIPKRFFQIWGALPSGTIRIPLSVAFPIAYLADAATWALKPFVELHPSFTVFRIKAFAINRYYSCEKAKERLGYKPLVPMEEALEITGEFWKQFNEEQKAAKQ